jgi:tetratricopeptide (TPR) repeat protein
MQRSAARVRITISAVILATQLANCLAPALAIAQSSSSNVQKGQEYYEQSRFDEAISLLKDLVDRGALSGEDLQRARELLARSYVKKGYPVQGKEMFKAILRSNPSWRPDPIRVPPDETAVFDQALKEFQAEGNAAPADTTKSTVPPATTTTTPPPAAKPSPTPASTVVPGAATETKEKKKSSKTLWYVLGGAVLIGGIAAAAAGGGSKSSPPPAQALSGFPAPPGP